MTEATEIERLHKEAVEAGEPFYRDPKTGYWVATSERLSRRGRCCDSGCRHCPYKDER